MESEPPKIHHKSFPLVFEKLFGLVASTTQMQPGRNLFAYILPSQVNVASVSLSGGDGGSVMDGIGPSTMDMEARITGRFATADQAQVFAMQVLSMCPRRDFGPIAHINAKTNPNITGEVYKVANARKPVMTYFVEVVLDVSWYAVAPA